MPADIEPFKKCYVTIVRLFKDNPKGNRLFHGSLLEPQDIECGRGSAETFELQLP
jgi:hypothetical protein